MSLFENDDILEFKDEYRWLSNFTLVEVILDGVRYPSVEHAYVSAKSDNPLLKDFCKNPNNTSGQVKRKGRKFELVSNWDEIKLDVMLNLLIQKFNQEPFKTLLKDTNNCFIQEGNNWKDEFWGVNLETSNGLNHLGNMIMRIRKFI